ncbi:early nodulin-like protein 6 [Malania oleifera]|uniref:early nodulin-like protein 6 n=1 Tax=Malania oleifera TaxID=397392 RepID=UPI0025AE2BEB|nr:early nodulin-like protein 6 [Malania oleifera]
MQILSDQIRQTMASALPFFFFPLLFMIISVASLSVSSYQFQVGGHRGWIEPTINESDIYNEWATKNRFHVGDSIYFKYQEDSVLEVSKGDYESCITTNPISKFEDGNTTFRFDRYGFFYFISGEPGHCQSGQKLIVRVMVQSEVHAPESAASPDAEGASSSTGSEGGHGWMSDNWGPPSMNLNSTTKLSLASYFMTALGGVLVILYLFM